MLFPILLLCLFYTASATPLQPPLISEHQNLTRVARQASSGLGTWKHIDGETYFIGEKHVKRRWDQAKSLCSDNDDSVLLSLDTPEKVASMVNLFRTYAGSSFKIWTSGNSKKTGSRYVWSKGDFIPNDYELWADGEPENDGGSEYCVMALFKEPSGFNRVTLSTKDCEERAMFVCQMK